MNNEKSEQVNEDAALRVGAVSPRVVFKGMKVIIKKTQAVAKVNEVCQNKYIVCYYDDPVDGVMAVATTARGLTTIDGREVLHPSK